MIKGVEKKIQVRFQWSLKFERKHIKQRNGEEKKSRENQ